MYIKYLTNIKFFFLIHTIQRKIYFIDKFIDEKFRFFSLPHQVVQCHQQIIKEVRSYIYKIINHA